MKTAIGALVLSSIAQLYEKYISKRNLDFEIDRLAHTICGIVLESPGIRNFSKYE